MKFMNIKLKKNSVQFNNKRLEHNSEHLKSRFRSVRLAKLFTKSPTLHFDPIKSLTFWLARWQR
jgi:hypothetical protein